MNDPSFILKLTGILAGMATTGAGLIRYYLHCRVQEYRVKAKLEVQKEDEKTKLLQAKTDEFRKEVNRLDGITGTLSDRLLTCAMDVREHTTVLRALAPAMSQLSGSNTSLSVKVAELHGQVTLVLNDFAAARNRLREKPIERSGGKTKLEGEKKS